MQPEDFLRKARKGALIRWTHPIQRLSSYRLSKEPDLNKWQVLEADTSVNFPLNKFYFYIDGWSLPFNINHAMEGFKVIEPTELSETLYVQEPETEGCCPNCKTKKTS